MCYASSIVAGYFIEKSNKESAPLSVLQLIKLVYISHGWNLVLNNKPLISDRIEAWKYGPVMPSLHKLFNSYGLEKDNLVEELPIEGSYCIKETHWLLLNKVYAKYKNWSGEQLTNLMHEKDTPWCKVWDGGNGRDKPINDDDTKEYYSAHINEESFDLLSEYPSIETEDDAIRFLKKAGVLTNEGELNPIYRNS